MPRVIQDIVYLDTKEISDQVKRDPRTIHRWIRSGKLKATKLNGEYLVSQQDWDNYTRAILVPAEIAER